MMKKILIAMLFLMAFGTVDAQKIKQIQPKTEDILQMLEIAGYKLYVWDLSFLGNKDYDAVFSVREYDKFGYVSDGFMTYTMNNLPTHKMWKTMSMGFTPVQVQDTIHIENVQITVAGMGSLGYPLVLLPLQRNGLKEYHYAYRPIAIDKFETDKFIPIAFYGSAFLTEDGGVRFCGDSIIPSNLDSDICRMSPHYYIIGVTFKKL